jgi:hypothetical protein
MGIRVPNLQATTTDAVNTPHHVFQCQAGQ